MKEKFEENAPLWRAYVKFGSLTGFTDKKNQNYQKLELLNQNYQKKRKKGRKRKKEKGKKRIIINLRIVLRCSFERLDFQWENV